MKTGLVFVFLVVWLFLFKNIFSENIEKNTLEFIAKNKIHHENNGKFFNPWASDNGNFWDALKWKFFSKNKFKDEKEKKIEFTIDKPDFLYLNTALKNYSVWLGHSTILIKVSSKVIITDPVFWDLSFFVKRKTLFPIEVEKLPKIDYVLISHGHYDHLDKNSLEFLKEKHDPYFISGPGYKKIFTSIGIIKHIELDWWENYKIDDIKITSLPANHWSRRTPFDMNEMLLI